MNKKIKLWVFAKMKKMHLIIIVFIISAIIIISALAVISSTKQKENIKDIILTNDTVVFYYGITCPHCKITEQYISDNNLDSKINIVRKEIYNNQANAVELQQVAKKCNIPSDEIGVPFMVYNNFCYLGDEETINLLKQIAGEN